MKTLILLRHAKSSWKTAGLSDHARPLNHRGRAAAPVMARWLVSQEYLPEIILCSSSRRTRETVDRMRAAAPGLPAALVSEKLYHAEPEVLLRAIRTLPPELDTAMIVAHEPGIGQITRQLSAPGAPCEHARAFEHFPTAAAAVFRLDGSWADFAPGAAEFANYAQPRDMMAS